MLATHNRKGPSAAAALLGTFLVPSSQAPRLDGISKPGASGRSLGHYSGPLLQFWLFRQRSRSLPNPGTARERSELDPKSGQPPRATHPYTGHTVTRPMLILSRFKTQTTSIPVGPGVQHTAECLRHLPHLTGSNVTRRTNLNPHQNESSLPIPKMAQKI